MAVTDFKRLGSESILSGHINGLHHSVGNLESTLNLETVTATDVPLDPVIDMDDQDSRYRVYEADIRGWVNDPAPIIYRDGSVVEDDEYTLESGFGVIVFVNQQSPDSIITADVTCISDSSTKLSTLEGQVGKIEGLGNRVTDVEGKVSDLENSSGGTSEDILVINLTADWMYNHQRGKHYAETTFTSAVLSGGNSIDFFPVIVDRPTEVVNMATYTSNTNDRSSTYSILGIYSSLNGIPHKLVAQSETFEIAGAGQTYQKDMTRGQGSEDLSEPVILEKGVYFMARYNSYGISYRAVSASRVNAEGVLIEIAEPANSSARNSSGSDFYSGFRLEHSADVPTQSITALPESLPKKLNSTFTALARNNIQEMYIVPVGAGD